MAQVTLPTLNLGFKTTQNPTEVVSAIKLVLIMTVLTLAPAILIMMTGFTRILIVLSFLRQALGVQQMPPNQLLVGLSLFLTFFVMGPAFKDINQNSLQPYMNGTMNQDIAIENALVPLRKFMFNQTRDQDLALFIKLAQVEKPKTRADVPTLVLVPAFIVSELKTAFMIGLSILIIGLIISIFQALTQINENTLTFVPKMVVIAIVLILAGPWMLDTLSTYTVSLFDNISTVVRGP